MKRNNQVCRLLRTPNFPKKGSQNCSTYSSMHGPVVRSFRLAGGMYGLDKSSLDLLPLDIDETGPCVMTPTGRGEVGGSLELPDL